MRLKWHAKWRNPVRKGARNGLPARSSTLAPRGEAISMSFGFDRLAPPPRCERLENEPHFPRFRSLRRSKPPQTISASLMSPSPKEPYLCAKAQALARNDRPASTETVQIRPVFLEPDTCRWRLRRQFPAKPPEPARMVHFLQMRDFVCGDVVEDFRRRQDQAPGK